MKHKAKIMAAVLLAAALLSFGASSYASGGGLETVATGCELVKGGLIGRDVTFMKSDFEAALGVSGIKAITVKELPPVSEGTLYLGDRKVTAGEKIKASRLSSLIFRAALPNVTESSFVFRAEGASVTDTVCRIRLSEKMNYAPSVRHLSEEWLSVSTQLELPIAGKLSAHDPEGDSLTYLATNYPKHGSLILKANGEYLYKPKAGYTGKDSFSYVVRDELGNYSEVAKVSVRVDARAASYEYMDLPKGVTYAAALTLEAKEIMQGRISGGGRYFDPDGTVSLSEFTVMAMKAAGELPIATETFFENNGDISEEIRGYIAAAQRKGYIIGNLEKGRLIFSDTPSITRAEAALILSRIAGIGRNETVTVFADADTIPKKASSAVYTLYDLGIMPAAGSGMIAADEPLSRAACAEMLAAVIEHLER